MTQAQDLNLIWKGSQFQGKWVIWDPVGLDQLSY